MKVNPDNSSVSVELEEVFYLRKKQYKNGK